MHATTAMDYSVAALPHGRDHGRPTPVNADITARRIPTAIPLTQCNRCRMRFDHGNNALRRGRFSEPGRIYHLTFVTERRTPWFRDHALATAACRTFAPSVTAGGAELLCWVLMPDHFHGLVRLLGTSNLSRCVQRLKGRATAACHEVSGGHGAIWAHGFHDHAMRREEDVLTTARYIIGNPQRAGLVPDCMCYPYWDAQWL